MKTERYNSVNAYLKNRFGAKVYKLSLTASTTCPNRDGTVGTRGCIFCSEKGSGEFAAHGSIKEQIDSAIKLLGKKGDGCKYSAYFQSFTNTYGDIDFLRSRFEEAVSDDRIVLLSIATRPDCLGRDVLEMLASLARKKPLWVELGLQTIHESTAKYIRRGYGLPVYENAVKALREIGAEVITHQIIGLPGEGFREVKETVDFLLNFDLFGIKIHSLYVMRGTALAKEYAEKRYTPPTLSEYCDLTAYVLSRIPPSVVIHRLTGDGKRENLIEPQWSRDKRNVLNLIDKTLKNKGYYQGCKYEKGANNE